MHNLDQRLKQTKLVPPRKNNNPTNLPLACKRASMSMVKQHARSQRAVVFPPNLQKGNVLRKGYLGNSWSTVIWGECELTGRLPMVGTT
jgi:hypothetical protein